mmetsp:Transcript_17436/g.19435  ORF Transcript_17436/g.19435 Transcript_17436/m.19435 type:complete len:381 (-) Transcript_17436:149-1291(-)|eukprot:CAMPEP_0194131808 /NCGR_PEP_ID=MMETSP0152-20130528/2474_1 /TAXON_ID=1049557 /ORGANISM="Thalassiothrix antarctica, Strain L6-D1" /LENGTH=380 /DNA_ID=CAMNT_0038826689 /DNA_START=75 /DNA_END=1217 /DNA_ORIENTATION=-
MTKALFVPVLLCSLKIDAFSLVKPFQALTPVARSRIHTDLWDSSSEPSENPVVVESVLNSASVEESKVEELENIVEKVSLAEAPFSEGNFATKEFPSEVNNDDKPSSDDLSSVIIKLVALASATGRGEFATMAQKEQSEEWIKELETANPTPQPTNSPMAKGTWELVYSSTQLFRSSPFFMAGRATCSTTEEAEQYDWFCDMHRAALAASNVGAVRQIVSDTRLVSEFEVKAGAVPFLSDFTPFSYSGGWPVTIDGAIVSSADITPTGEGWEIYMDTVEIKGSNIPGLRQVLDNGVRLGSRGLSNLLEDNIATYSTPKPIFETTYLSEILRISRDQDGKVFVYSKTSDNQEPTDYSSVESDLGFLKLLEGFNDSITKFYL